MMTKRLYYGSNDLKATVTVLDIGTDDRGAFVVLNETIAHVKGGGAKADRGTIGATAFNDVAPAIEKLLMLDEGVNCVATPELSIEEFLSSIKGAETAETKHLVMADKRFSVASLIAA